MKRSLLFLLVISFCGVAWATPVAKYKGHFDIAPNIMHKNGVQCSVQVLFDGDNLSEVLVQTVVPIYGKSEFPSVEQAVMSTVISNQTDIALVYRLQGPPHKWYFVYVGASSDQGKNYDGTVYSAAGQMSDIESTLKSGKLPANWKVVGTGTLASLTNVVPPKVSSW